MATLDYTGLRLTGALRIEHLSSLSLHVGVNDHGWAVVEGEAGEDALEQLQGAVAGREQVILARDESGVEQPLFAGIIRTAGLVTYGGYNRFRIELQTGTIQMDQVKRSRSFQDVGQTYSQVAQQVASGYEDGAVIPTVGLDKPLGIPVIQYRETDWAFMKRLASWCGGVVVPESHYSYPRLWFGFPERAFTCTFPEDCYTSGISQRYYELGGPAAGYRRADFLYYDVPSSQMCDLGWYTVFKGQEFLICEKWAKLERGELTFTYRLGKPGLGWGRKQYNDKISGMTILGEVLSTERETVRLKLDIDEGWAPGGPYAYTWRPETGNMMYCMPQAGTRVSLYFPNYDEQAAIAVNCVRTNGSSCARMSDPSKRSFVTEHGKEMNLYPQELSFLGGSNGSIRLDDEEGIFVKTDKKITVVALGTISLSGKTTVAAAPIGEIMIAKGALNAGKIESNMLQSNWYDLLSNDEVHVEGRSFTTYHAFKDVPVECEFNIWDVAKNFIAGMAMVAVVAGGIALAAALTVGSAGAAAPMIIGAIALGTSNVVGQTLSDISNQTVSDVSVYRRVGLRGAMVGAISGGLGAMAEGAIGATLCLGSKMGLMGVIGAGQTLIENMLQGRDTIKDELFWSFLLSAGFFGAGNLIADNWGKISNSIKSILGQGGREALDYLDDAAKQVDDAAKQLDGVKGNNTLSLQDDTLVRVEYGEHIGKVGRKKTLMPNIEYTDSNGYTYTTDSSGRIASVSGELELGEGVRNPYAQRTVGGADRLPTDDGGHLIGVQFNGSGDIDNLVPQSSSINRAGGEWYKMEVTWADALKSGSTVTVDIVPIYTGESLRPTEFIVEYVIDGKIFTKTVKNI